MVKRDFAVTYEQGLHARPASTLVRITNKFKCRITLEKEGKQADAKSLLQILGLGVGRDNRITVIAEGEDEAEAITAIERFLKGDLAGGEDARA